jgi:hypothetical protein
LVDSSGIMIEIEEKENQDDNVERECRRGIE